MKHHDAGRKIQAVVAGANYHDAEDNVSGYGKEKDGHKKSRKGKE
jgi:hypothetical protein